MTKTTVTILMIRYFPHAKIPSYLSYNFEEKIVTLENFSLSKLYFIVLCAILPKAKIKKVKWRQKYN